MLKRQNPGIAVVLADPSGSVLAGIVETGEPGPKGSYTVEGHRPGFRAPTTPT
jgi:cystathionine beta-synthase